LSEDIICFVGRSSCMG